MVDIDIEKFFDQVNQDLLMERIARVIRDKRVATCVAPHMASESA